MTDFASYFRQATTRDGQPASSPHAWQTELAAGQRCIDRLIRIPTGMGKTLGVLLAWSYHRVHQDICTWPTRLVWCLPMRTLVEQTANEARKVLANSGLENDVDVHTLMGGVDELSWFERPERPAILVGTQDMLLSRALNRGYAMGRAAWPRAFGLINNDALWVMDEVQLMGVGLITSAQIQSFWNSIRESNDSIVHVPRATWWMSATLQPDWLRSNETSATLPELKDALLCIAPSERQGTLWGANKPLNIVPSPPNDWATHVLSQHAQHLADPATGRQTLVVVNTVRKAKELFAAIQKQLKSTNARPEVRLIHSRFRPYERRAWAAGFLSRDSLNPNVNRILVATQVVEAGVDISASCLMTELAPWPSLVQRFGRAARYGGTASVIVLDPQPDEKNATPYSLPQLDASRDSLQKLASVSIRDLEEFESELSTRDSDLLARLYPYDPLHVLMRHEFEELFDTSPDLSGADMDVSRFIRDSSEERDIEVFWRDLSVARPTADDQPLHDELCSVSIIDARAWVKKLAVERGQAWEWDYVEGVWIPARAETLRPGMVLMVAASAGGYDLDFGFTGDKPKKGQPSLDVHAELLPEMSSTSDLQDGSDAASASDWKTIVTHCREACEVGRSIAGALKLSDSLQQVICLAMRLHDWGKAHPSFASGTYQVEPARTDLAKAPKDAWRSLKSFYRTTTHGPRPGFRHELASLLATLQLLRHADPDHVALRGEHRGLLSSLYGDETTPTMWSDHPIARELSSLRSQDFNLLLYLVASHHGKVRLSLQASPKDQEFPFEDDSFVGEGMPIRGVRQNDVLPATRLPDHDGKPIEVPELPLSLAVASIGLSPTFGPSWSERMLGLVEAYGPFALGYLEAIVRSIDSRASQLNTADPWLAGTTLTVPPPIDAPELHASISGSPRPASGRGAGGVGPDDFDDADDDAFDHDEQVNSLTEPQDA